MNKKLKVAFIVVSFLLLLSIVANVLLYERGRQYYLQLNGSHLDPLGLNVFADDPATAHPPVIVFFGDSRAAQWPAPGQIQNATFINRGIGNQTTAQLLGRFQAHVTPLHPQVIVIQAGINDLKTIPLFPDQKKQIIDNCNANLKQIIDLSLATTLTCLSCRVRIRWTDDKRKT
jgi:hypothetical protein